MSDRIQKVNIKDYFSPYFIRIWRCEPDIELKVDYVQPEQFLVGGLRSAGAVFGIEPY